MKRKLAILLVMSFLFSYAMPVSSVDAATKTATLVVNTLELMDTDKTIGTTVSRAQFAQILVNLSSNQTNTVAGSNVSLYPDVKSTYWALNYIQTVVSEGWMFASLNGYFKPDNDITLQEAVYGILGVMGYSSSDFVGGLSSGVMALYKQKELDTNLSLSKDSKLTKTDCIQLLYNSLKATTKTGDVFGESLGCSLDSSEEISYLELVSDNLVGPIIATSNWSDQIPFTVSDSSIYRNDKAVTSKSISSNDVLYYSKALNTIWAYSSKVTGTVKDIVTESLVPVSVTIASKTYSFETDTIANEFSVYGSITAGDIVTVLLGKDGEIAGVSGLTDDSFQFSAIVLSLSENGNTIEDSDADYVITVVDASGLELTYDYYGDVEYQVGALVQVTVDEEGAEFSLLSEDNYNGIAGTVNEEATKLGTYTFADDVVILDTVGDNYVSLYPSRLIATDINTSDVLYYKLNDNGEIIELILNNVTGDCYSYGMVTGVSASNSAVSYTYDIEGKTGQVSGLTSSSAGEGDPSIIYISEGEVQFISALTMVVVEEIDSGIVRSITGDEFKVSDDVRYYYDDYNGNYEYTDIDTLGDISKYLITAYYDEEEVHGGRVRVIVAKKKNS